ncbi:hypothetical protein P22_2204 [Propionispora sp. 2/2-37]|uniref:hypothetical protein n=1 Tax=Propionispora sp. 2/2-37 TaxID=1677858 RepID=UPI0006BB548E|nr:hypothetical protein [Propionispora sp. 2/2-37]CUH96116.1 hypothetical protein P22_2204 [Propionispora sp. 2/2-37]
MNIRSIDLQVLIPRATEVAKTQNTFDQQNTVNQQQSAEQWQKISADRQHQVQNTPKNEGGKIKERGESPSQHQQQHAQSHSAHAEQEEDEGIKSEDPVRGHTIDIRT